METFFAFKDEIELPDEITPELGSNFEEMIISILTRKPDPRLLPDEQSTY